jgi:hypothetical protein
MNRDDLNLMRHAISVLAKQYAAHGRKPAICCTDAAHCLGWTVKRVVAVWRAHAEALGGRYVPTKTLPGNPRAFNVDERRTRVIGARLVLDAKSEGKPLIEIL